MVKWKTGLSCRSLIDLLLLASKLILAWKYKYEWHKLFNVFTTLWASVAKWLAHLPFTSEAAGSNLTRYFLDATRTQSSCEKSKSQRSAESRGFSPGTPVSSHRES